MKPVEKKQRAERIGLNTGRAVGAIGLGGWAYTTTGPYDMVPPVAMAAFFGAIGWVVGAVVGAAVAAAWVRYRLKL